jgi:ankyrin repeat protein
MNANDLQGNTPLMISILKNNEDAVKLLLDAGADLFAENSAGLTAFNYAKRHPNIRKTLQKHATAKVIPT